MEYWLDLFTPETWQEFRAAGSRVTGFRETQEAARGRVRPGDIFVCYLVDVMRWVGALEVLGPSTDTSSIWASAPFPVRFDVRPIVELDPVNGVPMVDLKGHVAFFQSDGDAKSKWRGFVRRSPNRFRNRADAEEILRLLHDAESHPVERPIDPRRLRRRLYETARGRGKSKQTALVTVPEEPAAGEDSVAPIPTISRHLEIQYKLVWLGGEMGLDVWVARNDRSKSWQGHVLGTMRGALNGLPVQFNEVTQRTIELIDVLWLRRNAIVAAFEVESTTSIYSGLLRMSDLVALQPNLDIDLYLVAPQDREPKVEDEILRPTFTLWDRPLPRICGFLSFEQIDNIVELLKQLGAAASLSASFLRQQAKYYPTAVRDAPDGARTSNL